MGVWGDCWLLARVLVRRPAAEGEEFPMVVTEGMKRLSWEREIPSAGTNLGV